MRVHLVEPTGSPPVAKLRGTQNVANLGVAYETVARRAKAIEFVVGRHRFLRDQ
jgi:hypothetical protein